MVDHAFTPMDAFGPRCLRGVAQAVEAGEVSAVLMAGLHAEFDAARDRPQKEFHAGAIQHITDLAGVPETELRSTLKAIEAQPTVVRELLLQRFAEAWLEGQRKAHLGRPRFDGCPRRGLPSGPPGGGAGPEVGPTPGEPWHDDVTCWVPHYVLQRVRRVS